MVAEEAMAVMPVKIQENRLCHLDPTTSWVRTGKTRWSRWQWANWNLLLCSSCPVWCGVMCKSVRKAELVRFRQRRIDFECGNTLWIRGYVLGSVAQLSRVFSLNSAWGENEEGGPVDSILMPPIHDTRSWYHVLIGQIT